MDSARPDDAKVTARQLRAALQADSRSDGHRLSPAARARITEAAIALELCSSEYTLDESGVSKL